MVHLRASDTLAGRLQRGLGSGYLEALDHPPRATKHVLRSLANDPRIDPFCEDRDLYYARLILALDIDEAPLAAILAADAGEDQLQSSRDELVLGVLGFLAKAGRQGPIAVLRDYVSWGSEWTRAFDELVATGDESTWIDLEGVVRSRYAEGEAPPAWPPRKLDPSPAGPSAERLAAQPTSWLFDQLQTGRGRGWKHRVADEVAARVTRNEPGARALVEAALASVEPGRSAAAVHVLGLTGDPAIVGPAKRLMLREGRTSSGRLRVMDSLERGLTGLPAATALQVAREWRDAADYRRRLGERLLVLHATADDADWIVARIRVLTRNGRALGRQDHALDDYGRMLRRLPGIGPIDGFAEICRRYVPSCARADLIVGMSVADPTFGSTLAFECLFDCEPEAREAAARMVDLAIDGASGRLRALRDDRLEAQGVRGAASERLADEDQGPVVYLP